MKTMKHLLLISLLFLSGLTKAQDTYLPDEIWYDTGKGIYIQFRLHSIYNLDHFSSPKIFSRLYSEIILEQTRNFDRPTKTNIPNQKNGETKNTESDENMGKYKIPEDLKPDSLTIYKEVKFIINEENINCYFKNQDEMVLFLKDEWTKSIQSITAEFRKLTSGDKRKAISLHYRQNGNRIENTFKELNESIKNKPILQVNYGVGINFFKSKFLPSSSLRPELIIYRKGIQVNKVFANLEVVYDFISENQQLKPQKNGFLDIGFMENFTKNPAKVNWYGFSVGYLFRKKSDIFDDPTWRLSVHRNLSENIELVPQIYFPYNFSKVFPGLKFNVSF